MGKCVMCVMCVMPERAYPRPAMPDNRGLSGTRYREPPVGWRCVVTRFHPCRQRQQLRRGMGCGCCCVRWSPCPNCERTHEMVLPPLSPKKAFEYLKAQLVDLANANENRMGGTMTPVLQLIAENEVVVAVWQVAREPDGVGMLLIKGANRLGDIIAAGKGAAARMSAIKTIDAEQAEALRRFMGCDRTH